MARACLSTMLLIAALLVVPSRGSAAVPAGARTNLWTELAGLGWQPARARPRSVQAVELVPTSLFTDVTPTAMLDPAVSGGVAWSDYDGDGDADVCVADTYAPSHMFRNDGASGFVDEPVTAFESLEAAQSMAWADLDQDGDLDVAVGQIGLPSQIYRNDGGDLFVPLLPDSLAPANAATSVTWADVDRDGHVDLYVTDLWGHNRLLRNLGAGVFEDVTTPVLAVGGASMSATWGDYDADGDLDLYVVRFNLPNRLLRNDGAAGFAEVTPVLLADAGPGFSAVWADLDGDARLDLFLANGGEPDHLYLNDGQGGFTDASEQVAMSGGAAIGVAAMDADLDGDLDLIVTRYGDHDRLLENVGGGFQEWSLGGAADGGFSTGVAAGDMDGDGDLDAYVASEGDANRLLRNNQTTANHWLRLRLAGVQSNRAAIGALVRVVAGGRTQIREISGGSGLGSQDELMATFGLAASTTVDSVVIHWPNGGLQWVLAPDVDRVLDMTENPVVLAVGEHPVSTRIVLSPVTPNPSRGAAQIQLRLGAAAHLRLSILDAQGRDITTLIDADEPAGMHRLVWDSHDSSGRAVSPGLYLVQAITGDGATRRSEMTKMVVER